MYIRFLLSFTLLLLSVNSYAAYNYGDYVNARNSFEAEKSQINSSIDKENSRYINSLHSYQSCSSDKWRVVFTTVVPEIDKRRLALDRYKREALERNGALNSEWLKTAKEHNISQVTPDQDISDFYYWYQTHIELVKQGPLHELEVYAIALSKLTEVYEKMASACSGNQGAANDYSLVESGIRGLLDEVVSLIGDIL
ncbi:MAG: hypothetical protein ABIF87_13100 [Pseudomonadota bacterium]